jgi:hypothetical protein
MRTGTIWISKQPPEYTFQSGTIALREDGYSLYSKKVKWNLRNAIGPQIPSYIMLMETG